MRISTKSKSFVSVLLSGGIDSTACLHFLLHRPGFRPEPLFVDYGQLSATRESQAASAIAKHYDVPLRAISCSGMGTTSAGLIIGRNAFLVFAALMAMGDQAGIIALGVHSGTPYWDCSQDFIRGAQSQLDAYADGRVQLSAPFLAWSKRDIWDYAIAQHIPLQLTYSCELGLDQPCGQCLSCQDLRAMHA